MTRSTRREFLKQDRRNPGDANLSAMKALMHTIPDNTYGDLAAYYSSLR
jgi:cytochrome c553